MRFRTLAVATALLALLPACDRANRPEMTGDDDAATTATPAAARIAADVRTLADDRMEGRATGTRGYALASDHVARRFIDMGLEAGTPDGFFQRVPLVEARLQREGARFEVVAADGSRRALAFEQAYLPMPDFSGRGEAVEAPAVFVGQAVHAPGLGHDDFAGVDLRGKVAVLLSGAPASFPHAARALHSATREKLANVAARGAVAAVLVGSAADEAGSPWARSAANWERPAMRLRGDDGAALDAFPELKAVARTSAAAADELFAGGDRSAAMLADAARDGRAKPFAMPVRIALATPTTLRPLETRNVVARIGGGDAARAGEAVVITAHLDHLGVGAKVKDDGIHNGALDNALGVSVMLEAARILRAGSPRPARTVLFVATAAEEQGLLGAEWFVRAAAGDAGTRIVANLNLDMPVLTAPTTDAVALGAGHSTLDAAVQGGAEETGLALSPDPFPEEVGLVRSDQFAFVRAGIPALYLDAGITAADPERDPKLAALYFMRNCYHQPCDDADQPIQYEDAAKLAKLAAGTARRIADAPEAPRWNPGDIFGERFAPKP